MVSYNNPIMQSYLNGANNNATTRMNAINGQTTTSFNSVFTANAKAPATTTCSDPDMSLAEKLTIVATGLSLATSGVALAKSSKELYNSFGGGDKAAASSGTKGAADGLDQTLKTAMQTRDFAPLQAEVTKDEAAYGQSESRISAYDGQIEAKTGEITEQETELNTNIPQELDLATKTKEDAINAAKNKKDEAIAGFDKQIGALEAELGKAQPADKPAIQAKIDALKEQKKQAGIEYDKAVKDAETAFNDKKTDLDDRTVKAKNRKETLIDEKTQLVKEQADLKADNKLLKDSITRAKAELAKGSRSGTDTTVAAVTKPTEYKEEGAPDIGKKLDTAHMQF